MVHKLTVQQDSGLEHTVKKWFKWKCLNMLEWPDRSPDISLIEKKVTWLKDCCTQADPVQLEGAGAVLLLGWVKIPIATCGKIIETYFKRLAAIIAAKRSFMKYWLLGLLYHMCTATKSLDYQIKQDEVCSLQNCTFLYFWISYNSSFVVTKEENINPKKTTTF